MKANILASIFSCIKIIKNFIYCCYSDLFTGRARGIFFIGVGNILPDFLCFGFIRPILWRLAGVRLKQISTANIRAKVFTEFPKNLSIGKNFYINRYSYLDTNGKILIGDFVTISLNCYILTIHHSGIFHEKDLIGSVVIRDYCLIYANCTILPGSILEEGVVLAAGSVLKGPTEPWSIYAGNPAKLIGKRNVINID